MIVPNKHTDIRLSVPYIAGLALKEVTANGIIKYDELRRSITNSVGQNVGDLFEYAVSFLFLMDKIEYNQSSDTFKLIV